MHSVTIPGGAGAGTGKDRGIGCAGTGDGGDPARPGPALFEEMLAGWRRQQAARRLTGALIDGRERLIRRFCAFTGGLPWQWTAGQAGTWIAEGGWAHSTIRSYQGAVALFLAYACDPRYGWVAPPHLPPGP
jgi:integrase/recombinase XerC